MKSRKSIAMVLSALAACAGAANALAQEQGSAATPAENPAQASPRDSAKAQAADKAATQPAAPSRQKLHPRRHVWQVVGPEPTVNLGPVYSPTLTPRPPTPPPVAVPGTAGAPSPSPLPPGPAPLGSCIGNLCTDAAGGQYNIGTGNAGTNSQGRPCNRVGTTMQCF